MNTESDAELIAQTLAGSKEALEQLIKQHQPYIYNIALSFTADPHDAADLMQEVLIKMITRLESFKGQSAFRTWLYRIVKNHFLNMQRGRQEDPNLTFDVFGAGLDQTPDEDIGSYGYKAEAALLVEEAKISCMKGMLLCLDREQRLVYILGELFEFPDTVGASVMEVSRENFRVKLHRAKKQLYSFMNAKCGLVNKSNPCRCARKTAGFIRAGYVDPDKRHFQANRVSSIQQAVGKKLADYTGDIQRQYQRLYQEHPFLQSPQALQQVRELLDSEVVRRTFDLN